MRKRKQGNFVCFLFSEGFTHGSVGPESIYVMGLEPQWEIKLSHQGPETENRRHRACRCGHPDEPSPCHRASVQKSQGNKTCIQPHGLCKTSVVIVHLTWASGGHRHVLLSQRTGVLRCTNPNGTYLSLFWAPYNTNSVR